ncbi:MAG: peptide deformylase, partial [Flavobacteriales bacterium]|nr:peptide deformylase [Flavobacteriales bacterium]
LNGIAARIVQHEYDHIEGVLFTDHLSALKRKLLKRKLAEISKGITSAKYRMRFPNLSKKR